MTQKVTPAAMKQVLSLRTRFPWAVVNSDRVAVAVFNYKAEAVHYAKAEPQNLTAFDASGVIWEELPA